VALLDIRDTSDTAAAVEAAGGEALGLHCDVRSPAELDRVLTEAEAALGPISHAVAAAGVIRTKPFLELGEEDWDLTLAVNLKGTTFLLKEVGRRMVDADFIGPGVAACEKSGRRHDAHLVVHRDRASLAAMALAPYGITVNAVCPGVVDTPMTRDLHEQRSRLTHVPAAESLTKMLEAIPLGRIAAVDDVVEVILFLLSDQGSYVTGQSLNVCGGMELRRRRARVLHGVWHFSFTVSRPHRSSTSTATCSAELAAQERPTPTRAGSSAIRRKLRVTNRSPGSRAGSRLTISKPSSTSRRASRTAADLQPEHDARSDESTTSTSARRFVAASGVRLAPDEITAASTPADYTCYFRGNASYRLVQPPRTVCNARRPL
jgi:NAD(P)-dependent dehydrogenase (short-subunit alcohol dehydrogenase family)